MTFARYLEENAPMTIRSRPSTPEYRENHDRIFGKQKPTKEEADRPIAVIAGGRWGAPEQYPSLPCPKKK